LPIFERYGAGKQHFVQAQDDQETLAGKYSLHVYPTVLFFEHGIISKRLDGLLGAGLNEKQLTDFIRLCKTTEEV
jgi:hypothetical protein